MGESDSGLEVAERGEEVQHVTAERPGMVDAHLPAVLLGDLGEKVVVALIGLLADEFLRVTRIGNRGNGFGRAEQYRQCRADPIDQPQQQVFQRYDWRGREGRQWEIADRRYRDGEPAHLAALCQP